MLGAHASSAAPQVPGAPISARAVPWQAPLVQLPLQLRRAWASRELQGWAASWHLC